jgi:hypothetical protein
MRLVHGGRSFSPQRHKGTQSFLVRFGSSWFKSKLAGYFWQSALETELAYLIHGYQQVSIGTRHLTTVLVISRSLFSCKRRL